ncbi:Hypothetical predicted protein, partial [Pelobates cultripes]
VLLGPDPCFTHQEGRHRTYCKQHAESHEGPGRTGSPPECPTTSKATGGIHTPPRALSIPVHRSLCRERGSIGLEYQLESRRT